MNREISFSKLAASYPASGIRKMFDIAAKYDDVIKLTVGEPNFDTPEYIKQAAKEALDQGKVHYAPNAGIPELREAIAEKYRRQYWEGCTRENVIVTCGVMEGLVLALFTLVDPGNEVLITDPCFPNYHGQIAMAKGKAVTVPTYEEDEYRVRAEEIEKRITEKSKVLILNSPCNPTGAVLSEKDVREIAKVAEKYGLWVFSDEPYDSLVYDGAEAYSIARLPHMRDRVMVFNSFSKSYAMTGWRIGYILVPRACSLKMAQLQEGIVSCVSTFSQFAAAEALKSEEAVEEMRREYARRRDLLVDGINRIPGFSCRKSKGSFYAFVNIKAFGKSSQAFAEELVEKARVVTVPGSAFGEMGEGYLRLVFANSDENLKEALRRIEDFVRKYYPDICG